jgi:hypothetical protein
VKIGQEVKVLECDFDPAWCDCDCDCVGINGRVASTAGAATVVVDFPDGHRCRFTKGQLSLVPESD